ncbi:hypothetical protein, partial [Pseudomonas mosselii]|uniref:hypothetical protein n=1 Tax=Pseudomonas mosselii TaxID=78327 RepID=UPI001B80E1A8
RSVHQADLVKVRACLTAGRYRPAHKKSDTSGNSKSNANFQHLERAGRKGEKVTMRHHRQ